MPEVFTRTDYEDNGPVPRSKKLVACCSWSWGPANSRVEAYFISGSPSRREWSLWSKSVDEDLGSVWFNPAFIRFDRPTSRAEAAKYLLNAAWEAEWRVYQSPGPGVEVDVEGVLTRSEIDQISRYIFI